MLQTNNTHLRHMHIKTNIRYVFERLPEPNRACLVGHVIWYTESYQNLTPVGFGRCLVYPVT